MAWVTAAAPSLVVVPIYAGFCTIPALLSAKRGTGLPGFTPLFPVRRGIFQKSIYCFQGTQDRIFPTKTQNCFLYEYVIITLYCYIHKKVIHYCIHVRN